VKTNKEYIQLWNQKNLIMKHLSNWNGSFAKENQLGNVKTNKENIQLWNQKMNIHIKERLRELKII
jgi:hypothetical protein